MLVIAASVRRGGKSLAEIARTELGKPAVVVVSAAILFIVVIALAGLGFVVVKALGGDEVALPEGTEIKVPAKALCWVEMPETLPAPYIYHYPPGCEVHYKGTGATTHRSESFRIEVPFEAGMLTQSIEGTNILPKGARELVPGSSWGTFTIACTIPIGLLMGIGMRFGQRRGRLGSAPWVATLPALPAVPPAPLIGNPAPRPPSATTFPPPHHPPPPPLPP